MFLLSITQKYGIHLALKTQKPCESEVFAKIYIICTKKYQNVLILKSARRGF